METKKYIKSKSGRIYDKDNLYVCEHINEQPYGVRGNGFLIYKNDILASCDEVVKLFDCFLINKRVYDNFLIASANQKSHNKDKTLYGACWNEDGTKIIARGKYLGAGKWELL